MLRLSCLMCKRLFIILLLISVFNAFPFITLIPISASILAYVTKDRLECIVRECCLNAVEFNSTKFLNEVKNELHGQHIASNRVYHHLCDHMYHASPQKPLVFSFHGHTGVGKNFLSNIIVNSILKLGVKSRFYHFYDSVIHFKHQSKVDSYKEFLYNQLIAAVSQCPTSIFVFDEMQFMPVGILDVLAPILDVRESTNGVDFRKSIFIFISNSGSKQINRQLYDHLMDGKKREEFQYTDIDRILATSAYNDKGGLQFSNLISKHVITAMVPFLPLQIEHVIKCIQDAARQRRVPFSETMMNHVLRELEWFPEETQFYSTSGCKRVHEKVGFFIQQQHP